MEITHVGVCKQRHARNQREPPAAGQVQADGEVIPRCGAGPTGASGRAGWPDGGPRGLRPAVPLFIRVRWHRKVPAAGSDRGDLR